MTLYRIGGVGTCGRVPGKREAWRMNSRQREARSRPAATGGEPTAVGLVLFVAVVSTAGDVKQETED
jgi:hypothetical protein